MKKFDDDLEFESLNNEPRDLLGSASEIRCG